METNQILNQIQLSPSLEEILRVGLVLLDSLQVGEGKKTFERTASDLGEELRRSLGDRQPSELEGVVRSRRLYKLVGIDPTKERPSSERLLRRVLHSRPFPRINDLVDALNLVSLRLQIPLGYYDWDQLVPPILLRIGRPEESFLAPGEDIVHLQGRIVLVDGEGPFGNPTRDSERSQITRRTVRAMVVAFTPHDTPRAALEESLREIAAAAREACGGRVIASGLLPV